MICLNWMPFGPRSGASRRAIELHRHIRDLPLVAVVTADFPKAIRDELAHVRFQVVAERRSLGVRLRECRAASWSRWLGGATCRVWVTDTLPVVRLDEARSLYTVQDVRFLESLRYTSFKTYVMRRMFMRRSLARADRIVTVSEYSKHEIVARLGVEPERIAVIPNAVEPVRREPEASPNRKRSRPFLLLVGHLERRKNVATVIRAMATLSTEWDGELLVAGGDGGELTRLDRLAASLGVSDRVSFLGPVDDGTLATLYGSCELLVCPSLYEGFGMTLLQGMAHGRPVVASRIPPHEEVAGDAAEWFDPQSEGAASLVSALRRVLAAGPRVEAQIARGHARAARDRWESASRQLAEQYVGLLERSGPGKTF